MRTADWTALLPASAGVLTALAALASTDYRTMLAVTAAAFILLALVIGLVSLWHEQVPFTIEAPRPDQVVIATRDGIGIRGTVLDLGSDTLWVFEEGLIDGKRVWFFGGEVLVNGTDWSFDYDPGTGRTDRNRRTLSVVRADRDGERQLRGIRRDGAGRLVVYDPAPGGCVVLGQVSVYVTVRM